MEAKLKVILIEHTPNIEDLIACAAKLCYSPSDIESIIKKREPTKSAEFVRKLCSMGHESPLEHASYTFGIEGISRACSHQLVRHRIASYSQQSQRYVREGNFDYIIPPSFKKAGLEKYFMEKMENIQKAYNESVEALKKSTGLDGEAINEDARYLLPNACETKIIMTMNARELIYFLKKRTCNRAQWEIRALAKEIYRLVYSVSPSIFEACGPECIYGRCKEGKLSCGKSEDVRNELNRIKNSSI